MSRDATQSTIISLIFATRVATNSPCQLTNFLPISVFFSTFSKNSSTVALPSTTTPEEVETGGLPHLNFRESSDGVTHPATATEFLEHLCKGATSAVTIAKNKEGRGVFPKIFML
jgi:hypothetical protein